MSTCRAYNVEQAEVRMQQYDHRDGQKRRMVVQLTDRVAGLILVNAEVCPERANKNTRLSIHRV